MTRFSPSFLDEIRSRVPISEIIGRRVHWDAKKTRKSVGDYWAPCPFHGEKSPSFHVVDKKGFYHCFGCGASGDHFRFLTEHDGLKFHEAVAEVANLAGISMPSAGPETDEQRQRRADRERQHARERAEKEQEDAKVKANRILSAGAIWKQTIPLAGTLGETYFEWRCPGLAPPANETELRFHPKLEVDPEKPRGDTWPAIVARVSDVNGKGVAIWRIYLARDGKGKMPVRDGMSAKLGYGPSAGGAVRLGGMAKTIGICEGVETSLAIRRLGTPYPVWPALSTSGIIGFQIPTGIERIICFPDPDGAKLRTKTKNDGTTYIAHPPGREAVRKFIEKNPGADIRISDAASNDDYLEVLQGICGVPKR